MYEEEQKSNTNWKVRGDVWGLPACPSSSLLMARWLHFWEAIKDSKKLNAVNKSPSGYHLGDLYLTRQP